MVPMATTTTSKKRSRHTEEVTTRVSTYSMIVHLPPFPLDSKEKTWYSCPTPPPTPIPTRPPTPTQGGTKKTVHFAPPCSNQTIFIPSTWNWSDHEKSQLYYSMQELGRMATRERLRKQIGVLTVALYRAQVLRLCRRGVLDDVIPVHQIMTRYHKILVSTAARMRRLVTEGQPQKRCHETNNDNDKDQMFVFHQGRPITTRTTLTSSPLDHHPPISAVVVQMVTSRKQHYNITTDEECISLQHPPRPPAKRQRRQKEESLYHYPTTVTIVTARAA
jgi:hypothetical protein